LSYTSGHPRFLVRLSFLRFVIVLAPFWVLQRVHLSATVHNLEGFHFHPKGSDSKSCPLLWVGYYCKAIFRRLIFIECRLLLAPIFLVPRLHAVAHEPGHGVLLQLECQTRSYRRRRSLPQLPYLQDLVLEFKPAVASSCPHSSKESLH